MAAAAAELATFCDLAADSLSLIEVQLQDFRFCLEHVVFQTLAAFAKLQLPWTTHDTCLQLVWLGSLGLNGVFLDMLFNPRTIVWPTTFGHVLAVSFGLCPGLLGFFLLRSAWCGLSPWFFALGFLGPCLLLSWLRSFWRWGWRLLPARAVLCEWCAVGLVGGGGFSLTLGLGTTPILWLVCLGSCCSVLWAPFSRSVRCPLIPGYLRTSPFL